MKQNKTSLQFYLALPAIVLIGFSSMVAADTLLFTHVSQIVSTPSGHRDVYDIFRLNTAAPPAVRLTIAASGKEFDSTEPNLNHDATKVVFSTYRHREDLLNGNTSEVYVMDSSNGANLLRLSTNSSDDDSPTWCGSSNTLVFSSTRQIPNAANTNILKMTAADSNGDGNGDGVATVIASNFDEYSPDCSPDGTKVVFVRRVSGADRKIVVADISGGNEVTLTTQAAICQSPKWSATGEWIVYACNHHGPLTAPLEIYRMKAVDANSDGEGDNRERLTNTPLNAAASNPVWSPNDTKIAYQRNSGAVVSSWSKTIGASDDAPISNVPSQSFVYDWR